ncbi:MAG: LPS biosynthesis protein WbpP [Candidatus Thermofonsia Clade 1 bacterium]|uniref:LPS biosynthesis protein WbpP n=2 Tax=Candidatus Thermofonsia Clade 1 bacterium TaxID=2364210 RepID=A0A2M8PZ94_9CHLR|nr:MAG: LPS biosynthesis protein WbpP [Candidatus Thermofonsia Clade 1 bacterium]PJF42861.1 MAG: LPS biosynthesis protein WbpP [Candidatus Thermofonsia Clade 1 bacterium]
MATYLVTGGAGFIGSHLVDALLARGETVRVVDNFATGSREYIESVRDQIAFYEVDIADLDALREPMQGVDYVLHQAAIPSVPRSVADPRLTHDSCATGTLNVLIAARDAQVKRVIYAASSSAYGDIEGTYKREDMPPRPLSPYAVAKLVGEQYCQVFYNIYGLETVALRYFNVFGPRQDPNSPYSAVIPLFIKAMLAGAQPIVFGDGTQSRDFTYIENVVQGNLLACKADGRVAGKVINLACGESINLLDLIAAINTLLGTHIVPIFAEPRPGDVKHSCADIRLARELLGFTPSVSFEEGLRRTLAWLRNA